MDSSETLALAVFASLILFILFTQFLQTTLSTKASGALVGSTPIKHIVIIMQENHAFDNYFGTYPGALGFPNGTCIPYNPANLSAACVKPWLTTNASESDLAHAWRSSNLSYDYGKMDGFVLAAHGSRDPLSYYDNKTIPYYWDYAKHYVLADHFFSSALSYSLPNHWYTVAASAPNDSFYYLNRSTPKSIKNDYLNESNRTETVGTMLDRAGISWKYYDFQPLDSFKLSVLSGDAFSLWNPFAAKSSSYTQSSLGHLVGRLQIFSDIKNGALPQVSWVMPNYALSEHPPSNVTWGMWYVTSIVDSVMQSRYWNSTAIIIVWDDFGGYYDNVPPPVIDQRGLGFRVPALIISPYAKTGYVDHTLYDFESTLAFMEWNFGLGNLTARDGYSNSMLNAFNFSQRPRAPYVIQLNKTQADTVDYLLNYYKNEIFSSQNATLLVDNVSVHSSDFDT